MSSFTSLDQVLNSGALTPAVSRSIPPGNEFRPLFAHALTQSDEAATVVAEPHGEPQIELVQENGRIQQIVVICRCGERTVLDCAY